MRIIAGLATLILASALVSGCGGGRTHAAHVTDPQAAVLRAGDLQRGYVEGDDTACGLASTEDPDSALGKLFLEERPRGCTIELQRVWEGGTGPPGVTSAAYVFGSTAAAEAGFRDRDPLLEYSASVTARTGRRVDLGDEARLARGRGLNDPAVAVVWRSGNVVAILAVEPANAQDALTFARRQQKRILGTAPAPHRVDTTVLQLDDPSLTLPVYWLGRSFNPGGRLPQLDLNDARETRTGPGDTVELEYTGVVYGRVQAIGLQLWRPDAWRQFRKTRLGRLVWDSPCAKAVTVRLSAGRAEIFTGYGAPRPLRPPCPSRPPDRVVAHVYLPGVVVSIDMPFCYGCAALETRNPYETVSAMTAIARGLRLRRH